MKKRIKIWFHSGNTSNIKEFAIHKSVIGFALFIGFSAIGVASLIGYDYFQLKKTSYDAIILSQTINKQHNEIKNQRTQIQSFAVKIEALKKQVDNLSKFEDKVRLIADINQTSDSSGLIGIGGIPKNELGPDIPLGKKHNNLMREMHQQINQTSLAAKKQGLDFEDLIKQLEQKRNYLASTPSIRPVNGGWITSKFGYRTSPFTGQKDFHSGIDISNRSGTEIIASADGRISYAARKMYIGNMVVIDHGHGLNTRYGHLKKILVKEGQKVKRGDVIALLGNTGQSTGPHVHYEIQLNGTPVNPLNYILN
ncbi:MAG: M23 family metallopeptidase [Proteobacteria bacterium]|nr:M23 family metallopeptidase [Pseudomonadota bacterium]